MVSDWEVVKLKNAAQFFSGGTPPKSKPEYWGGDIPWISAKSMKGSRYHDSDLKLTEAGLKKGSRLAPKNSILLLVRGSMLHQKIPVGIATKDVAFNQDVKAIVPNEKFLPLYFYYCFAGRKHELLAKVENTGIGAGKLDTDVLNKVEFYCPPIQEQKVIANFLGSLDDKIELNRQMNETLEAMAQALFKSWFVDFDPVIDNALAAGNAIPDEFSERAEQRKAIEKKDNSDIQNLFPDEFEFTEEMGWIPKGWEVKRIKDIGKVVTGKTPPKKIDNAYSENGIPFITPTDIDDLPFVIYTNRYLSEDGVQAVKNSRISAGSICVTCIGSQMGKTTIAPLASVSNQQINSITGCKQFWRNYLFFNLRRRRDEIFLLGSSGSTMPILNKSNFEAFPILCPREKLLSSLDSNFQNTIDSILENTKQSYTLTKLRHTLLPKLMSGELRIADAAAMVEDT